ncbi:MAG: 50S ribosomal protein L10 [Dehalococcoidia bacterium]
MPTEKKVETVEELRERIERSVITIAADYRGLSVTDMVQLRRAIADARGVEMRVVKNRLFLRAADAAGHPEMAELMDGPTAIIFGYEDVSAPARVASEYQRTARNTFAVRKGVMDGRLLTVADLQDLGSLPPREVLIALVAGALQSPVARLAGLLTSMISNGPGRLLNDSVSTFSGLLEARAKQMEGA